MVLTSDPQPEDTRFLEEQINRHNMVETGRRDFLPLALFVREEDGGIVAGLDAFTWAGWLEIKLLWVRDDLRGRGLGRRLLEAAETEARERGCHHAWLDSYSFQAPTFYEHHGYEVFGKLEGYPASHERVFLTRSL
jgi:GNAT superfamily N-acetyltransferase